MYIFWVSKDIKIMFDLKSLYKCSEYIRTPDIVWTLHKQLYFKYLKNGTDKKKVKKKDDIKMRKSRSQRIIRKIINLISYD